MPKIMAKLVTGDERQLGWYPNPDDGELLPIVYERAKLAMRGRGAFAITVYDIDDHEICGDKIVELWEEHELDQQGELEERDSGK